MTSQSKWSCEYCTYENWPAAKKCTLCRAPRPLCLINEDAHHVEQDIYKIAPLITSPDGANGSGSLSPGSEPRSKWTCHVCTYLNWPKAVKCTQCLTPKLKISPIASASTSGNDQKVMIPLSVNVNISEHSGAKSTSRNNSPNSPEAAKELNNDRNKAVAAAAIKWNCKACTYENWPKAVKCILCGTSKGKLLPEPGEAAEGSNINEHLEKSSHHLGANLNTLICASRPLRSPTQPCKDSNLITEAVLQGGGATASPIITQDKDVDTNRTEQRRLKQIRNRLRDNDWLWLNACTGVVDGDPHAVEAYISSGGDPARQLTPDEIVILNRPSAFEAGYTLVHLAIRFQREDMLAVLLTSTDAASKAVKRMPSHISPDIAMEILREISASIRQRKGDFPCYFLTDCAAFVLPAEIEDLPRSVKKQLFDELLDRDVQKELEVEEPIINWSHEITERLGSRLYALWNRTAGDCLLDSVLQATYGLFDRDNTLRRALGDSLNEGACVFYPRWKEYESMHAQTMHFSLDENQWQQDWAILLSLASQPGASLEQTHIFAVAHILRRPIIVYGVKFVKSFRGENIGLARFQGVYLPLLWEQSFCWKDPIALGYTRGHFSALVPMEIDTDDNMGAGANIESNEDQQTAYMPLVDSEGKLLPVHFLTAQELGKEESILKEWLDCCVTDGGLLVAQQKIGKTPTLVRQMVDEWLERYRRLAHVVQSPSHSHASQTLSSDGETDDE